MSKRQHHYKQQAEGRLRRGIKAVGCCADLVLPLQLCCGALLSRGFNTIASVFWRLISIPHR